MYFKPKKDEVVSIAINAPISFKFSVELAREIRHKPVSKVLKYLDDIIELKRHVPLKRFKRNIAHRKGDAISGVKSGRYPVNVAKVFKKTLESAISNADFKGLDKDHLLVMGSTIQKGVRRFKIQPQGRRRIRRSKSTNVELLLKEMRLTKIKKVKKETETNAVKSVKKETKEVKPKTVKPKVVKKTTTKKVEKVKPNKKE